MSRRKHKRTSRKPPRRQAKSKYLSVELHGEPIVVHDADVAELQREAIECLHRGEGSRAEELLQEAIAQSPDAPDLLNNLAAARQLQGRFAESQEILRDIYDRFPDYLFGRANMAHLCLRTGNLEQARELLAPLLLRKRMHFSEFAAFCAAEIDLALHDGDTDAAETWLQIWEEAVPEHPALSLWRKQVRGLRARLVRWCVGTLRRKAN
jgi:tetratricopeptide (TPR) repeat protein